MTRSRASEIYELFRSLPIHSAVRPKPVAAILATVTVVTFCADIAAVFDQSSLQIGLLPEIQEGSSLEFVKKCVVFGR